MSATPHLRAQLSAYLDGALSPADRSAVDAHLATCADCRARLAQLRATSRLIASLESPVPTRRLVPRVAGVPAWLAPLRTLSTLASGIAVFMFIASALLTNIGFLASSGATTTAASSAPLLAPGAAAVPAPASTPAPAAVQRNVSGASAPTPSSAAAQDAAKFAASPSTGVTAESVVSPSPVVHDLVGTQSIFGSPWLWLAIAVLTGALAILLQRRLRAA